MDYSHLHLRGTKCPSCYFIGSTLCLHSNALQDKTLIPSPFISSENVEIYSNLPLSLQNKLDKFIGTLLNKFIDGIECTNWNLERERYKKHLIEKFYAPIHKYKAELVMRNAQQQNNRKYSQPSNRFQREQGSIPQQAQNENYTNSSSQRVQPQIGNFQQRQPFQALEANIISRLINQAFTCGMSGPQGIQKPPHVMTPTRTNQTNIRPSIFNTNPNHSIMEFQEIQLTYQGQRKVIDFTRENLINMNNFKTAIIEKWNLPIETIIHSIMFENPNTQQECIFDGNYLQVLLRRFGTIGSLKVSFELFGNDIGLPLSNSE